MGNLLKTTVLLVFAVMLSFVGITGNEWNNITHAELNSKVAKQSQPNVSQSKQIKYLFINRTSEIAVSPVSNPSAPNPKPLRFYFLNDFYSIEDRIQRMVTLYLSQSKDICCSLASNDIIYPFHYFW